MRSVETPWPGRALILATDADDASPFAETCSRWLAPDELETASRFRLPKRRNEWLLSRVAAKQLALRAGAIDDPMTCRVGRPFLEVRGASSEWQLSMSHSAPYAAAIVDRRPVGIDVQVVRELDENAAHLFLSDAEADDLRRCSLAHRVLHFWCAKEAAWKQRSGEFATMKQVPLRLVEERANGLLFDAVETLAIDDLIVAVTRPTS